MMKTKISLSVALVLLGFAAFNAQFSTAHAAVAFTITPSTVSNTYSGQITLQVAGLSTGGSVVVQKFIDGNTNGVIDGNDWLVQQFNMTDGQAGMTIGGIVNSNVPGDTDTTAGQITAKLNFQSGDIVQSFVGKYLVKVSGNFTPPLTNVLTITNFPFAQKFTGNVISNATSTVVSNAIVVLMTYPEGVGVCGTVANNAGGYTIAAPAGTYELFACRSNYLAGTVAVALGSGATVTTNLFLTNATTSISGKVVDSANSSFGLPGTMIMASANGLMGVSSTDTNGNFTVRVQSGQWGLKVNESGLIVHGYLGLQDGTNVNAGATLTNAVPKGTSLIYGSVKDSLGNPMAGIELWIDDNNQLYESDAYTDTNGNYCAPVLGGLGGSDPWWPQVGTDTSPTNYVFSQPGFNNGTNIIAGTASQINFTGLLATNHITGTVKDSNNNPVAGVGVWGNATINSTGFFQYVNADDNGNYSINVANGSWSIGLETSGGTGALDDIFGHGNYVQPNNQTATISNNNATNNFIVQLCNGISISPASPLPAGEVGVYYSQSIQASDCSGIYNWSQTGGMLPNNLNLNATGSSDLLYGYPSSAGNFVFTVQVNDGGSNATNRQYAVAISNAVQITTTSLPGGTNGSAYSQQMHAIYGVPFNGATPYNWSVTSGTLPPNLNLSGSGLLSGTAATNGTFNFIVQAADSLGGDASTNLSLVLISTNYPALCIGSGSGQMLIFWPASCGTNYTLQMTTNLATGPWVTVTNCVPQVAFTVSNKGPAVFFRLH